MLQHAVTVCMHGLVFTKTIDTGIYMSVTRGSFLCGDTNTQRLFSNC